MMYFPDEKSSMYHEGLEMLNYNSNPEKLQKAMNTIFNQATKQITIDKALIVNSFNNCFCTEAIIFGRGDLTFFHFHILCKFTTILIVLNTLHNTYNREKHLLNFKIV